MSHHTTTVACSSLATGQWISKSPLIPISQAQTLSITNKLPTPNKIIYDKWKFKNLVFSHTPCEERNLGWSMSASNGFTWKVYISTSNQDVAKIFHLKRPICHQNSPQGISPTPKPRMLYNLPKRATNSSNSQSCTSPIHLKIIRPLQNIRMNITQPLITTQNMLPKFHPRPLPYLHSSVPRKLTLLLYPSKAPLHAPNEPTANACGHL